MTTTSVEASSPSNPQPPARPSPTRKLGALYLDLLLCTLLAWDLCTAAGQKNLSVALFVVLFIGMKLWCRDRIQPTPGEFCMGIRYLTSSSSQVVAEIQVLNPKLRLNAPLLAAGAVEMTLAYLCLAAWTFLDRSVLFGRTLANPFAFGYWLVCGAAYLACASYILCGSQQALFRVPAVHAFLSFTYGFDLPEWGSVLGAKGSPWLNPEALKGIFMVYCVWSVLLVLALVFFRSHLVHRYRP